MCKKVLDFLGYFFSIVLNHNEKFIPENDTRVFGIRFDKITDDIYAKT